MSEPDEALMEVLSQLTASELRKRLQDAGLPSGPITQTTRRIFETKLARFIKEKEVPKINDDQNTAVDAQEKAMLSAECCKNDCPLKGNESDGDQIIVKTPEEATEPTTSKSGMFFGVCIPTLENDINPDRRDHSQVAIHVYKDRNEVLKVLKMNQGARFKVFKTEEEAKQFSSSNQEISSSIALQVNPSHQILSEKGNNFKSPKTKDLVHLMEAIQQNDMASFQQCVWSNPRYLISSADTPVILMGGPRYNALHVAAKHNVPTMCREILKTIENDKFLSMVFVNDTATVREERSSFLLDLYMNTPDKGQYDTPLHFASKFGNIDVVEVLVQHPLCDRGIRNKYGYTPRNVICERCDESRIETLNQTCSRYIPNLQVLKSKIESLLNDNFYVPVFRAEGNTMQGVIGEPWSPDFGESASIHTQLHASPISPSLQVKAFAGPMSPQKAYDFHSTWKSPSKSRNDMKHIQEIRRGDDEKGLERIGRNLAHTMAVPWSEYWGFLGKFADLSTEEGLTLLENYLQNRSDEKDLTGSVASLSLDEKVVRESEDVAEGHGDAHAHGDFRSVDVANTGHHITPSVAQCSNTGHHITPSVAQCSNTGHHITPSVAQCSNTGHHITPSVAQCSNTGHHITPSVAQCSNTSHHITPSVAQCSDEETVLREKITKMQNRVNDQLSCKPIHLDDCLVGKSTLLDSSAEKIAMPISQSSQEKFLRRSFHHDRMQRETKATIKILQDTNPSAANNFESGRASVLQQEQSCDKPSVIKPCQHTPCKLEAGCHSIIDFQVSNSQVAICMDNISTPKSSHSCHPATFIQGFEPSKLDMNVYLALENISVPCTYPHIIAYKQLVESFSVSDRKSWKTPIRLRRDWSLWQEHASSPLTGGRSEVKAGNIPQSLSPTSYRRRLISTGSNAHNDIKEKLFVDAT